MIYPVVRFSVTLSDP